MPGRTYPVADFYLEDILEATGHVISEGHPCALRRHGAFVGSQKMQVPVPACVFLLRTPLSLSALPFAFLSLLHTYQPLTHVHTPTHATTHIDTSRNTLKRAHWQVSSRGGNSASVTASWDEHDIDGLGPTNELYDDCLYSDLSKVTKLSLRRCPRRPRLHYRLLTLCSATTGPVGQSWPCVCIYVCMCAPAYVGGRSPGHIWGEGQVGQEGGGERVGREGREREQVERAGRRTENGAWCMRSAFTDLLAHVRAWALAHTHACTHACAHAHMHATCTRTCTHAHVHTCAQT